MAAHPPEDTHAEQAERIALHCEHHPGRYFSGAELAAACDLGSASKVLSEMALRLGYGIAKSTRRELVNAGHASRRRTVYRVTHRPSAAQLDLFPPK